MINNTDQNKTTTATSPAQARRPAYRDAHPRGAGRYIPIKVKVILFFGALAISLAIVMVVYFEYSVRVSFKEEVMSNFHVVEEKNMGVYAAFIGGLKVRTLNWSSDNYIKELAQTITDPALSPARRKIAIDDFGTYLRDKKMRYDTTVLIADILDQNGVVIASSRAERIGTDELKEELEHQTHYFTKTIAANFGEVFARSVIFEEDETTDPMFHITTRLFRTDLDAKGDPIPLPAVLLVHFVSLPQLSLFLTHSRPASDNEGSYASLKTFKTLETYVVNKDRLIVSPTRSIKDLSKKQRITTKPVEECFVNGREIVEEYLDYRGVLVVGASTCLTEDGLVLVSEMETSEAYATLDTFRRKTIIGGGVVFIALALIIFFATRRLLSNLDAVTFAAKWFSLGVFDERAPVVSQDEIGQLATAFNIMLDKIGASKRELTENLKSTEEQNKFLEETKKATLNVLEDAQQLREQSEAQKNRLQTIISSIGEGLILVNQDYVITLANPMAGKILDLPLKDIVGKKAYEIIRIIKGGKDLSIEDRPISRVFATKQDVEIKLEDGHSFHTISGKEFPVAISATPLIKDNDVIGSVVVFRDISVEKALDESKSSFISIASHQLRTPLTSIRWYSEMLLDEEAGPLNKEQKSFAFEVNDGTLRLYNTIDLLLSLSRVENGTLKHSSQKVNLGKLLNEVMEELKPQLAEKTLTLNIILPEGTMPEIELDPLLMRQVFLNLIANSIRYTNNGGIIEAKIEKKDGEFLCYVRDNGIGIPESEKPKIFSKFFRAQNALEKVPDGSGLGLSLVKGLVESWGGKVWFESEEGKGTTFYFIVPEHPIIIQKTS